MYVLLSIAPAELSLPVIPVGVPDLWVGKPPDDPSPYSSSLPTKAPDILEEKKANLVVLCPNPYATESINTIKQLFDTTKMGLFVIQP